MDELSQLISYSKLTQLMPTEVKLYSQIAFDRDTMQQFKREIQFFTSPNVIKPDDILRRFSLNGDGRLDFREFVLAMKKLASPNSGLTSKFTMSSRSLHELYLAFCPRSSGKIDITIFCQIMAFWSSQLMKLVSNNQAEFDQDHDAQDHDGTPEDGDKLDTSGKTSTNVKRALVELKRHSEKLKNSFFQMDIECSGWVSLDELQLALYHVGIQLTEQDFQRLCHSLESSDIIASEDQRIKYMKLIAFIEDPANSHQEASSSMSLQRLWDILEKNIDSIAYILRSYLKSGTQVLSPLLFRECLAKCGIQLSNTDFVALRMSLQQYQCCDTKGDINLRTVMDRIKNRSSVPMSNNNKSNNNNNHHHHPQIIPSNVSQLRSPRHAAGSTTKEKHAKESRFQLKMSTSVPHEEQDRRPSKPTFERTIVEKIKQQRTTGEYSSLQAYFPGDRFGKITRGQFRQGLAHLGVIARYCDVEDIFWKLDPHGYGKVSTQALYAHIQPLDTRQPEAPPIQKARDDADDAEAPRSRRRPTPVLVENPAKLTTPSVVLTRLIDGLLDKVSSIVQKCAKLDRAASGLVSRDDFIWSVRESGGILSDADARLLTSTLSSRRDGVVSYPKLLDQLHGHCSKLLSPKSRQSCHHLCRVAAIMQHDAATSDLDEEPIDEGLSRRSSVSQLTQGSLNLGHPIEPGNADDHHHQRRTSGRHYPQEVDLTHHRFDELVRSMLHQRHVLQSLFRSLSYIESDHWLGRNQLRLLLESPRLRLWDTIEAESKTPMHFIETFLEMILPPGITKIGFPDFIRYLELFKHHREARESDNVRSIGTSERDEISTNARLARGNETYQILRPCPSQCPSPFEVSLRQKIQASRLRTLASGDPKEVATAGVVIRHIFRSRNSGGGTTTSSSEGFDVTVRCLHLKAICINLGLDLTSKELAFLQSRVDPTGVGVVSSSDVLAFFIALTRQS